MMQCEYSAHKLIKKQTQKRYQRHILHGHPCEFTYHAKIYSIERVSSRRSTFCTIFTANFGPDIGSGSETNDDMNVGKVG